MNEWMKFSHDGGIDFVKTDAVEVQDIKMNFWKLSWSLG